MKIITITLNPAFDIHCNIDKFEIYKENYAYEVSKNIGGKGINISRALTNFDVDNTAYVVLGNQNGSEFSDIMEREGIRHISFDASGRIRENMTVHSAEGETRISFEGFPVTQKLLGDIYNAVKNENCDDLIVTFTGRLPNGINKECAIDFLHKIKSLGAKLVVDCNSFSKEDLIKVAPYLIKPNEQEVVSMLAIDLTLDNVIKAACELCKSGIENVIVSLGQKGFVYANENTAYVAEPPMISPVSTIGAGDSLIAGYIKGLYDKSDLVTTLKTAASFGTAACLTDGTNPPKKEMVSGLIDRIKCVRYL